MKLSWLIELIDMNTGSGPPQAMLMGALAWNDARTALMQWWDKLDPSKRCGGFRMMISGIPIFLDLELPGLGILLLRNDGSRYLVEETYRP